MTLLFLKPCYIKGVKFPDWLFFVAAINREAKRLVILDVEDFPILRHWHVVYRKGKRLSPVAQEAETLVTQRSR